MRVWTQTMPRCAEKTDTVSSKLVTEKSQEQHIFPARVKQDYEDSQVIQSQFTTGKQFNSLDKGVIDKENLATCDQAEETGASI